MARLACADVRSLPLQLLLRRQPAWRALPVAVVSRDSPQGTVLAVNRRARRAGVCPGLSYAGGLSFTPELRGGVVSRGELSAGVRHLAGILQRFSPTVEACAGEPGVFWLDVRGLVPLFASLPAWSAQVREALQEQGFRAVLAAGFTPFGCYAAAKAGGGDRLFDSPLEEREAALRAPLEVLDLPAEVLQRLRLLGVATIGAFLALPPRGLRKRFGAQVERLHDFAAGGLGLPVLPPAAQELLVQEQKLPEPTADSGRLLAALERALGSLLERARQSRCLVRSLRLRLALEDGPPLEEPLAPAFPTRGERLLRELLALRLERLRLPSPAAGARLEAAVVPEDSSQQELFAQVSRREREQAARTLARLRAVYGSEAVQVARLQDDHLPERSFAWESPEGFGLAGALPGSAPGAAAGAGPLATSCAPRLVRRLLSSPRAAELRGLRRRAGPFFVSGRWWAGESPRRYYYGEDGVGQLLWVSRDAGEGSAGRVIGVVE